MKCIHTLRLQLLTLLAVLISATSPLPVSAEVTLGNERPELYLPLLKGKRVGLLSNHTGIDHAGIHTADKLKAEGVDLRVLFSPEHGFRGTADAGEKVGSGRDAATGLPVVSLYGGKKVDLPAIMDSIDVVAVDIQDVGLRFYTYYITMLRLMNSAARAGKEVVVLDRPNPNGMSVDGPVLDMELQSGVGKLPVPVLHGMTLGELALMINGEGWLDGGRKVKLSVVPAEGYTHSTRYELLNMPSPNLKSMHAIYLYPSTCLFEGTPMSLGRGTDHPFEVYGHPQMKRGDYRFTPRSMEGAKHPPLEGRLCRGRDLRAVSDSAAIAGGVNLEYVIDAYRNMPSAMQPKFFTPFFDKLIGTRDVARQIRAGKTAAAIRASWQPALDSFRVRRAPYLLYPE
ncbi:MAG: DUF1343 domain-containing protein [Candidatus Amulumruptor caecigallinarius]|nr:DUF1343 domain-containing protein [Candidatus Amulumruptor caecigallinarius]MCM1397553.1 DUF1343 domain-containing protein [Candidatus Amulumruptor caecigallinarius]MCM1454455.1 DUF1343 domain-containing protein [bacterium]